MPKELYSAQFGRHRVNMTSFVVVFTGICLIGIVWVRFEYDLVQGPGAFKIERKSP